MPNKLADKSTPREVHPRRRARQSGATIVEAAVIILPFFALFFALFDYSMALFLTNTMQFAVRQGVRYAVTSQVATGLGQDDSIRAQVNTFSFGFLSYLAPGMPVTPCAGTACVTIKYFHHDTSVSPPTLTDAGNGAGSNAAGNVVVVTAGNLVYNWMIPFQRSNSALNINVSSADIMEAQPGGPPAR